LDIQNLINGQSAGSASSQAASSALGLAESFDSFLTLLTTQLANQDPLEPLDANQFTEQLVQFTGVEQAINTNRTLEKLVGLMRGDQMARSVDYLGAEVVMGGDTLELDGTGPAEIHYELADGAAAAAVLIRDELGRTVFKETAASTAGAHTLTWDGRDGSGEALPHGTYHFEVRALDASGAPVEVTPGLRGTVDAVEFQGNRVLLSVGGELVPADTLTSLKRALDT
jgi:flagellar basal-body rod modification protein FlgD